ncbi:MAG: energy-coupling factor transporter transmembrane component T [Candidatus Bipolaricaulota bacterium]|nr:energy-coupling factor transporter transmembrane component T [Candidatus Bipolaricaulota bacterium]
MIPRVVYSMAEKGLHRASPEANLLLLLGFLAAVLAAPGIMAKLGALALVFILAALSGERLRAFLWSTRFVLIFAAFLFVAQAISIRAGETLFSIGVTITDQGLLFGAQMALRFLVILSSSMLFVMVTDPDRFAHSLIRLGIPYRYGFILVLALRFVPFFRQELKTVREAQQVRGVSPSIRNFSSLRRTIRYTFLPVLVSGLTRVDSIAISMKGRCFGLHPKRTISQESHWGRMDWIVVGLFLLLIGSTIIARRYAWL